MGVFNRFISAIRVNDDEYDEDEFYEEEDEALDFEDENPKKSFFSRFLKRNEDDDYEDEDDDNVDDEYSERASKAGKAFSHETRRSVPPTSRVTPMQKRADRSRELRVVKPTNMEDTRNIADVLLANGAVILNLEALDVEVAQRVIDFSSGVCYTLNGSLQQVSSYIFVLTPKNIGISGDVAADLLKSSVPTMKHSL